MSRYDANINSRSKGGNRGSDRGNVDKEITHFHFPTLLVSLLAGVIGFFICEWFYNSKRGYIPSPVLIGIYFLILIACMFVMIIIMAIIRGELAYHMKKGEGPAIFGLSMAGIVAVCLLASLFQYIYSRDFNTTFLGNKATSYVFVLDDSGSMLDNDPQVNRLTAVRAIVEDLERNRPDFPYAIYTFSSDTEMLRPFMPASYGMDISLRPGGGTSMFGALSKVLQDYDNNVWHDDRSPRVVLLADGVPTDKTRVMDYFDLVDDYANRGITISSIYLSNKIGNNPVPSNSNEPVYIPDIMKYVAEKTNGVALTINNANLSEGMNKAATDGSVQRDLMGRRPIMKRDWLYFILRIVFITILAIGAKAIMALVNHRGEDIVLILIAALVAGIIAGITIELGINKFMVSDALMRLITCILIAFVPSTYTEGRKAQLRMDRDERNSKMNGVAKYAQSDDLDGSGSGGPKEAHNLGRGNSGFDGFGNQGYNGGGQGQGGSYGGRGGYGGQGYNGGGQGQGGSYGGRGGYGSQRGSYGGQGQSGRYGQGSGRGNASGGSDRGGRNNDNGGSTGRFR